MTGPRGLPPRVDPSPTATTARILSRIRIPLLWAWVAMLVVDWFLVELAWWLTLGATVVVLAIYFRLGRPGGEVQTVRLPVVGRWVAMNSPGSSVPSHGLHAYGQTYAIDLVAEPEEGSRPWARWWPPALPPEAFPGFGQPVLSPVDGRVVRARQRSRDHWSRSSWPGLAYLMVEAVIRELTGPGRILGNHLVIESDDGCWVLMAHLRKDSIRVAEGDPVMAGQMVAACGNSGNSTEPHLHLQLMDHPSPVLAGGVPFVFGPDGSAEPDAFLPANGEAVAGLLQR